MTFLSHFINADHMVAFDPMLAQISKADRERLLDVLWPMTGSVNYHQQEIEGANGRKILLNLRGVVATSRFFESCVRRGDKAAVEKVHEATRIAMGEGSTHIGLGQFTSIVSENETLLSDLVAEGANITTGNSLTVGFAYQALKKLASDRGRKLSEMRVGVVGVAGNICNVYAQIIADEAGHVTLMHREPYDQSPKFQSAVKAVLANSSAGLEKLTITHRLEELALCDAIVLGTNTTGQFLMPEHLKQDAIVLDISVPSNVHPSVLRDRPDVECFQGGYAKLPGDQKLRSRMVPCLNGETFACMAETITLGLHGYPGQLSFGPLSKAGVLEALKLADEVGIRLGSLKKIASF